MWNVFRRSNSAKTLSGGLKTIIEDSEIIELFLARRDEAIAETQAKYHAYCYSIAVRMLKSPEDAEECVNDALLAVWNSIPPNRPEKLSSYLATLTRNEAISRLRKNNTLKRGGKHEFLPLEELAEVAGTAGDPATAAEEAELTAIIERFVKQLPEIRRIIFIDRYWFWDPIPEISARTGFSEARIYLILHRLRKKLAQTLEKEGYIS